MQRLLDIGFTKSGHWARTESGIERRIKQNADAINILYCFISDNEMLYVGKTVQQLKKRMYGYQKPSNSQATNIRVNDLIIKRLDSGCPVDIYALPDHGLLHFGAFHLNLAAGLEDSIIATINPPWNKTGKN